MSHPIVPTSLDDYIEDEVFAHCVQKEAEPGTETRRLSAMSVTDATPGYDRKWIEILPYIPYFYFLLRGVDGEAFGCCIHSGCHRNLHSVADRLIRGF